MEKYKEGEPVPQHLNTVHETVTVLHSEFDGEIMTINKASFDPKKHTLCNELGQKVDEKGRIVESKDIKAVNDSKK